MESPQDVSGSANVILYVGLCMVGIGLVITFVGLGDNGFKTTDLKLIGPSLVGCGVFFALLRILFCTAPGFLVACFQCCRRHEDTEELLSEESEISEDVVDRLKSAVSVRRNGLLKPINLSVINTMTEPSKVRQVPVGPQIFPAENNLKQKEQNPVSNIVRGETITLTEKVHGDDSISFPFSSSFSLQDLDIDVRPDFLQRPQLVQSIATNVH